MDFEIYPWMSLRSPKKQAGLTLSRGFFKCGLWLPIPRLTNDLLNDWHKVVCQLTLNAYTYLSILEALLSAKMVVLTPRMYVSSLC